MTVLDDPDAASLASSLARAGAAGHRLLIATRPDVDAAALLLTPRFYGLVEMIEDRELFLTRADFGRARAAVFEASGGWPVLVDALAQGRSAEVRNALPDFLKTAVLPTLAPALVTALFAALAEPLSEPAVLHLLGAGPLHPLLRRTREGVILSSAWVEEALRALRVERGAIPRRVLDLLIDMHARFGRVDRVIQSLNSLGQTEHALALFERAGGPFFGFCQGFASLETVLGGFGADAEQHSDTLLLARVWLLVKLGRPREALLKLDARFPDLPVDLRGARLPDRSDGMLVRLAISEDLDEAPSMAVIMSWIRLEALLPPDSHLARGVLYNSMAIGLLRSDELLQARLLALQSLEAYERAGSPYLVHFMRVHLADISLRQSRLREAAEHLQLAQELLAASGLSFNTEQLIIDFFKARLAYEEGRFQDCPAEIEPLLEALLEGDSWPGLILGVAAHIAFAAYWRSGLRAALDALENCIMTLGRRHGPMQDRGLGLVRVRLYQIARRHAEALARFEELDLESGVSAHLEAEEGLARLRTQIAHNRPPEAALESAQALSELPRLEPRHKISLAILQALLHQRESAHGLAKRYLILALRHAESENLLGVLIEEGESLERLLPILTGEPDPDIAPVQALAKRVIRALKELPAAALHSKTVAGISRQEHRVLSYAIDGYTNKEVARALHLSEGAVKFHLRSLFRKLGVASRSALFDAARRRGVVT